MFVDRVLSESSSALISTVPRLQSQTQEFHALARGPTLVPGDLRTTLYGPDFLSCQ